MMEIEVGAPAIDPSAQDILCLNPAASLSRLTTKRHPERLGPELDLLLACAVSDRGLPANDIFNFVRDDLDWQKFLQIREHHRLIPQVYSALRHATGPVPKNVLAQLHKRYQANVRQTLRLTRDLLRVLKHFESCRIPVLAYKGPVLAQILGGGVTARQFADLDLLVHRSDVQNAKSALAELEYIPQCPLAGPQGESYIQSGYEYAFDLPDAANVLELKWRILPRFYSVDFDVAGFFDRAITIEVAGHPMRTLCSEDLLLVLCVHAAKHAWSELSLLWDIAQLVQSQRIDWDSAYARAAQLGIRRILDVNFALAYSLMGNPLPLAIPQRVKAEAGIGPLTPRILSIIRQSQQVDTEAVSYFCLMLSLRERWRDRVRFLWRLLATPGLGEWSVVSLPPWLFPFYYMVRMYRIAARLIKIPSTWKA